MEYSVLNDDQDEFTYRNFVNVEENRLARQAIVSNILFGLDASIPRKKQRMPTAGHPLSPFCDCKPPAFPSGPVFAPDASAPVYPTDDAIRPNPVARISPASPVVVSMPVNLRQ